ncbi:MAG: zinc-ribbon domain-containing protein [Bacillota bacterium]|nr:zinc-ribbon domain-containing protein [Bacillota bacterium]
MENSLNITNPELASEWNYEKNGTFTPSMATAGMGRKVWWKGKCGHQWQAVIQARARGNGCPYCSNRILLRGFNDLANTNPELLEEWDYGKNDYKPTEVKKGTDKKAWWICKKCGFSWNARINTRTNGDKPCGCPACDNKVLFKGRNDFKAKYPGIAAEWDYEKNDDSPENYFPGSSKRVWWMCQNGHSWKMSISLRSKGRGCPICNKPSRIKLHQRLNGVLIEEWDSDKNLGLSPEQFTSHSSVSVWWKCPQNHSYKMRIAHRTDGHGCPYCAGERAIIGENDLATTNPELIEEWDYGKNKDLSPTEVMRWTEKKVWWKGKCGHEWMATIASRAGGRTMCPICNPSGTSFPEQACSYYLRMIFNKLEQRFKLHGRELDIYIDEIKTAVEYDGFYFHKGKQKLEQDNKKDAFCDKEGIRLIRIREEGLSRTLSANNIFRDRIYDDNSLNDVIAKVLSLVSDRSDVIIDVSKDYGKIQEQYMKLKKEESLAVRFPIIAKEWDNQKNAPLSAFDVKSNANRKAWWICPKGHSYRTAIQNRTRAFSQCPYCAGRIAVEGKNDLFTLFPELKDEWDFDKNIKIDSSEIRPGSGKKVWWKCSKCGFSWMAVVAERTGHDKTGCPSCARKIVWKRHNDLETEYPNVAKMWCYEKNKEKPSDYLAGSGKKVWWQCEKGHVFIKPISTMVLNASCPVCGNREIVNGINDVATIRPELMKEWDYQKNTDVSPFNKGISSRDNVWWICPKGHSYNTAIINRTSKGTGCPYCAKKRVIKGETDLLSTNPEFVKEWDYDNNTIDISSISAGNSRIKVFWKCDKGHTWQEPVSNRIRRNTKCPYCFPRKTLTKGVNDLETVEPRLALEWDHDKNGTLKPSDVMRGSGKKVWWLCKNGHSYYSSINNRTSQGLGCPYCSGQKVLQGYNDLATTDPSIAAEWNYELNGTLTPRDVSRGCNKKVWWTCSKSHNYDASVNNRTRVGIGCPFCSGHRVWTGFNDIETTNPEITIDWNYGRNDNLSPKKVSFGSNRKVWWKCHLCGYEWQSKIIERCKGGKCPNCKGKDRGEK